LKVSSLLQPLCLLCITSGEADWETDPALGQDAASVSGENSVCRNVCSISCGAFLSLRCWPTPTNPASLASPRLDPGHQLDLHSNSLPDSPDSSSAFFLQTILLMIAEFRCGDFHGRAREFLFPLDLVCTLDGLFLRHLIPFYVSDNAYSPDRWS
jgi:hypothetical protein